MQSFPNFSTPKAFMKSTYTTSLFLSSILVIALSFFTVNTAKAQCDSIEFKTFDIISKSGFISDGQQYKSFLLDEEVAEFHATFYGGATYRIAVGSGPVNGNLIFRLYDAERNELFNNIDFSNAMYWDFEVTSTLDVIIEAQLDPNELTSGCAVILIGFKQ